MKLNKWDYRYPFFGIQKLHNYRYGYGYGLPIFPKVNVDSNFLSIVNRLENEMKELQGMITEETLDDLRHLLEQFNGVDSVLNVDDVQAIVDYAIGTLEFPDVLTIDEVKQEITDAINVIDVGLTVMEVQILVGEMLDELELGLSQTQVETLIHESISLIDTGLNQLEVQFLIEKALMDVDKGLSEEEIIELIEFHSQTIPLDSIINDIDNLRRDFEMIEIPDVDLTPILVRIEELKNSMDDEYDDTHIINMINDIRSDIDNIDAEDVDLSEIYNYLNSLEEDVSRIEYDDSWIHTELDKLRNTIANVEIEGVDLTLVYDRLSNLETAVDNDTIYDDTAVKNEINELRNLLNNLQSDVDDMGISNIYARLNGLERQIRGYDDEINNNIKELRNRLITIESDEVDLSHIYQRLDEMENTTDYDDEWIQSEISEIVGLIESIEIDGVDLSSVYEKLNELESSIDDYIMYDDTTIKNEISEISQSVEDIRFALDNIDFPEVDFSEIENKLLQLEEYVMEIPFPHVDNEWYGVSLHSVIIDLLNMINTSSTVPETMVNKGLIDDLTLEVEGLYTIIEDILTDTGEQPDLGPLLTRIEDLEWLIRDVELFDYDAVMGRLEALESTTYYWDGASEDVKNWLFENNAQALRFSGEGVYDPENLWLKADEYWINTQATRSQWSRYVDDVTNRIHPPSEIRESTMYEYQSMVGHNFSYTGYTPGGVFTKQNHDFSNKILSFRINPLTYSSNLEEDPFVFNYSNARVVVEIINYKDNDGNVFDYHEVISRIELESNMGQFQLVMPTDYDILYIFPLLGDNYSSANSGRYANEINTLGLWIIDDVEP